MTDLNGRDLRIEYDDHYTTIQRHLDHLKKRIEDSGALLEGNSFYHHNTLDLCTDLYKKQINLYWTGKQAISKICEIGFNAGHSTMLFLLGRDATPLDLTIFDIGHHPYIRPCLEYIKGEFPHVNVDYIEGDSTTTMPKWIEDHPHVLESYDVIHVDGGHSEHCIHHDMMNSDRLLKKGGLLVVDDISIPYINYLVDVYVSSGRYKDVDVLSTKVYSHRILRKL